MLEITTSAGQVSWIWGTLHLSLPQLVARGREVVATLRPRVLMVEAEAPGQVGYTGPALRLAHPDLLLIMYEILGFRPRILAEFSLEEGWNGVTSTLLLRGTPRESRAKCIMDTAMVEEARSLGIRVVSLENEEIQRSFTHAITEKGLIRSIMTTYEMRDRLAEWKDEMIAKAMEGDLDEDDGLTQKETSREPVS